MDNANRRTLSEIHARIRYRTYPSLRLCCSYTIVNYALLPQRTGIPIKIISIDSVIRAEKTASEILRGATRIQTRKFRCNNKKHHQGDRIRSAIHSGPSIFGFPMRVEFNYSIKPLLNILSRIVTISFINWHFLPYNLARVTTFFSPLS